MGQLGDGTSTNRTTPVRVGTLSVVMSAAGGRDHGLALLSDGTVWAWGDNTYGQVGDGTYHSSLSCPGDRTHERPGAHGRSVPLAALLADGTVRAWGRNNLGQLGDGSLTTRRTPVAVSGLSKSSRSAPVEMMDSPFFPMEPSEPGGRTTRATR